MKFDQTAREPGSNLRGLAERLPLGAAARGAGRRAPRRRAAAGVGRGAGAHRRGTPGSARRDQAAAGSRTGAPEQPGFVEYSTATGKLTRVLYRHRGACVYASADVMWASPSGNTVAGSLDVTFLSKGNKRRVQDLSEVGVFGAGEFKRLSFPLPAGSPPAGAIAW